MLAKCKRPCYASPMATLYVREIPDEIYRTAQRLAEEQGRSLSAYVITILERAIRDDEAHRRSVEALEAIRRDRRSLPPDGPDVVTLLRKMRGYDD
jgi:predicted DNA-binding protein